MSSTARNIRSLGQQNQVLKQVWKFRSLYLMGSVAVLYFIVTKYLPLLLAILAFKDYDPTLNDSAWIAIFQSPWIGPTAEFPDRWFILGNMQVFVQSPYFLELMRNTLVYSFAKLLLGLPMAIFLALALYETILVKFRQIVQTITYLPHFLSWVIMLGVIQGLLSPTDGLFNVIASSAGGQTVNYMAEPFWFPFVVIISDMWKEMGWSAIIFLAALMGIDPVLYEAADVEGASRWQRLRFITIPGITEVIVVVTLLRVGNILDAGFQQLFMLYSLPVYSVGDILDTWVYRSGVLDFQLSLATAVGIFKGVIGTGMLVLCNTVAKKITGNGLY